MKTVVCLFIICGIASIVKASPGAVARRRCGQVLEDFLSKLCKTYSEPDLRYKKSDSKIFVGSNLFPKQVVSTDLIGPLYQDYENGVTLNQLYDMYLETVMVRPHFRHGRVRRQSGIVDECCLNPCGMETMILYCSN